METSPDPFGIDRRQMVDEQLRARGVRDARVLEVMARVPRDWFLPEEQVGSAYSDRALPLACGQTISQPYMVAVMSECLRIGPDDRVLEIGTGSGYQTAVLAELAAEVYTVERLDELQRRARSTLASLGILNVAYRVCDGTLGWPEAAPFHGIIVTAAAPAPPPSLLAQLAEGGRLVIPVGSEDEQTLTVIERQGSTLREYPQFACRFVKLIGAEGWPG